MPIGGDAVVSELAPGTQRSPWIGNCVAVGEAAIAVDPLDALDLHVTHGCISHLMTCFPATAGEFPEADAYNRSIAIVRLQPARFPGRALSAQPPLRRAVLGPRARRRPAARPCAQGRHVRGAGAGSAQRRRNLQEQSWAALLLGCGVMPQGLRSARRCAARRSAYRRRFSSGCAKSPSSRGGMPTVEQFLALDQPAPAQVVG